MDDKLIYISNDDKQKIICVMKLLFKSLNSTFWNNNPDLAKESKVFKATNKMTCPLPPPPPSGIHIDADLNNIWIW